MGLAAGKVVLGGNIDEGEAVAPGTVTHAAANVVLTSQSLHPRRYLPEAGTAACLAEVLSRPIAGSDSHPPWWSGWSRARQLKLLF